MGFDLPAGLEIVRPWLTTGFIGGILALAVKLYIDNRRLKLAEKSRGEDFQLKVSVDGRSNLQFVIDNLVRDITAQRTATEVAGAAHARCEEELQEVRADNRVQGNKLDGLCRQFIAFSESVGRAIPPANRSPEIDTMMARLAALAAAARDEAAR